MENLAETVNYAVIYHLRIPLAVIISLFVIMAAATAVLVIRELKKTE